MAFVATPVIGRQPPRAVGRRAMLLGLSSAGASLAFPRGARAGESGLVGTPRQTLGPFYPVEWSGDIDNDLVVVTGEAAQAMGTVLRVKGRVLDLSGSPVAGARVEIWQCDANGIYLHPRDMDEGRRRDGQFQGRGRTTTAGNGAYEFRTIRPVPYPGRTPHIHFQVERPSDRPLVTQMYVAGEPLNERDAILAAIRDPRQRDSVIVRLEPADGIEAGSLGATFDIVLG